MASPQEADLGTSVFKDEQVLGFDYIPAELPTREPELHRLNTLFRGVLDGRTSVAVGIRGPVGTGKTAIAKAFVRDFREEARRKGRPIETAYVNCRTRKTDSLVLLKILRHFDPAFPERGFSTAEMLESLRKILKRKEDAHLIIILDEVDALLAKGHETDLFYQFTRFDAEDPSGATPRVSLIAISQHDVHTKLDAASASTFPQANTIRLDPYAYDAMRRIVEQRVEIGFRPRTVNHDVQDLVADIASRKGDARLAIELLRYAGINANDVEAEAVTAEHVRLAKSHIHSEFPEYKLKELGIHPLLTLLALCRRLVRDQGSYAITGNVEKTFQLLCEEYGADPRGHTSFYNYIKHLNSIGFLDLRRSGKGQAGTTQYLSLPDVPASELAPKVEEILKAQRR